MAETGKDILKAKALLEAGELVAIPTETVYGLAGNALLPSAIATIFSVKGRPKFDPLIVHVTDISSAKAYIEEMPEKAVALANRFWPGPLTLVLKKKAIIPDLVTAGLDTVGIRCPRHSLTQELLASLAFPLAAPSANPFGYVSPTQAAHVNDQLGKKIKFILDGGNCEVGIESTIVGFTGDTPVVYRMGGVRIEEIETVIGSLSIETHSTSNPLSPGQLKSHYAPRKKVVVGEIDDLLKKYATEKVGLLTFNRNFNFPHQFILSPNGSLEEAAQNLFAGLRFFDRYPVNLIIAEFVPENGLGRAINDRLRRAAAV